MEDFFPDNFEPSSVTFHAAVVFGLGPNFLFKNLCEDFDRTKYCQNTPVCRAVLPNHSKHYRLDRDEIEEQRASKG